MSTYPESKIKLWNTLAVGRLHHVSLEVHIRDLLVSLNELLADLLDGVEVIVQLDKPHLAVRASAYFSDVVEVLHRKALALELVFSPLVCLLLALWLQGRGREDNRLVGTLCGRAGGRDRQLD